MSPHQVPHTWAVGSTFEYEFEFPVITHRLYGSAKPDPSKKPATYSTSRPAEIKRAPEPKIPAARKTKGTKLTHNERKERDRSDRVALRQRRKEPGICRHCKNLAVPGRTRCQNCAEKRNDDTVQSRSAQIKLERH